LVLGAISNHDETNANSQNKKQGLMAASWWYPCYKCLPSCFIPSRRSWRLLMFSLYNILICLVAAVLYVAVNKLEPNPRDAAGLKILIIGVAGAVILAHLTQ
jgi:hypothetical protein